MRYYKCHMVQLTKLQVLCEVIRSPFCGICSIKVSTVQNSGSQVVNNKL